VRTPMLTPVARARKVKQSVTITILSHTRETDITDVLKKKKQTNK